MICTYPNCGGGQPYGHCHKDCRLRTANIVRDKEWDAGGKLTTYFRLNELMGEVGEACNVIKKLERERLGLRGSLASTTQLAEELADVMICADLFAMAVGHGMPTAVPANLRVMEESLLGAELGRCAGMLCDLVIGGYMKSEMDEALLAIVTATHVIAAHYDIVLDNAIVVKFNATSAKLGLQTRMAAP